MTFSWEEDDVWGRQREFDARDDYLLSGRRYLRGRKIENIKLGPNSPLRPGVRPAAPSHRDQETSDGSTQ